MGKYAPSLGSSVGKYVPSLGTLHTKMEHFAYFMMIGHLYVGFTGQIHLKLHINTR